MYRGISAATLALLLLGCSCPDEVVWRGTQLRSICSGNYTKFREQPTIRFFEGADEESVFARCNADGTTDWVSFVYWPLDSLANVNQDLARGESELRPPVLVDGNPAPETRRRIRTKDGQESQILTTRPDRLAQLGMYNLVDLAETIESSDFAIVVVSVEPSPDEWGFCR